MARLLPRFSSNDSPDARWIHRVTENLRAAFLLPNISALPPTARLSTSPISISPLAAALPKPMPLSSTPPSFARFFSF